MDATERPLKIPLEFASYADKHHLFEVFKRLLTALIIKKPDNPADFIIEFLKDLTEVPHVLLIGPPGIGKSSLAMLLSSKLKECPIITSKIFEGVTTNSITEWCDVVTANLKEIEDKKKGWIMDGIVTTRKQAIVLSEAGFIPSHVVFLTAPNEVLHNRIHGKLYDEKTGEIYHKTFKPPSRYLMEDLVAPSHAKVKEDFATISEFCLNVEGLKQSYKWIVKEFNADQPMEDLFAEVHKYVCQPKRTDAPHTPRVLIFGPEGSDHDIIAKMLADKYKFSLISYQECRKNEMAKSTKLGEILRLCEELCTPEPDEAMFDLINKELDKIERHSKGWIINGYPANVSQAQFLQAANYEPNRVFFIKISNEKIVERLSMKKLDPVTGKMYHMVTKPPPNERVLERLEVPPSFEPEKICFDLTDYRIQERKLKDFYSDVTFEIDGDMSLEHIFESIESKIVNPMPSCVLNQNK